MSIYFINTDWEARQDVITCDLWFKNEMAFAGDYEGPKFKHANLFRKLNFGDILFMYHSRRDKRNHHKKGYIGIGRVLKRWDSKCYQNEDRILYQKEKYEYRIVVDWFIDWRDTPKHHKKIGLPITSGTWGRIDENKYPVQNILKELVQ